MNAGGRGWIESSQQPMNRARPFGLTRQQPGAQRCIPLRARRQAVEQRPKVKSRTARHHRQSAAPGDFVENRTPYPREVAGREEFVRIRDIDHVMRDTPAAFRGQFGGADIEKTVNLYRIAVDHLAIESRGKLKCQLTFAATGGSGDRDQNFILSQRAPFDERHFISVIQ